MFCCASTLVTTESIPAEVKRPCTTMASDSCSVPKISTSSGSALDCVLMLASYSGWMLYVDKASAQAKKQPSRKRLSSNLKSRQNGHTPGAVHEFQPGIFSKRSAVANSRRKRGGET